MINGMFVKLYFVVLICVTLTEQRGNGRIRACGKELMTVMCGFCPKPHSVGSGPGPISGSGDVNPDFVEVIQNTIHKTEQGEHNKFNGPIVDPDMRAQPSGNMDGMEHPWMNKDSAGDDRNDIIDSYSERMLNNVALRKFLQKVGSDLPEDVSERSWGQLESDDSEPQPFSWRQPESDVPDVPELQPFWQLPPQDSMDTDTLWRQPKYDDKELTRFWRQSKYNDPFWKRGSRWNQSPVKKRSADLEHVKPDDPNSHSDRYWWYWFQPGSVYPSLPNSPVQDTDWRIQIAAVQGEGHQNGGIQSEGVQGGNVPEPPNRRSLGRDDPSATRQIFPTGISERVRRHAADARKERRLRRHLLNNFDLKLSTEHLKSASSWEGHPYSDGDGKTQWKRPAGGYKVSSRKRNTGQDAARGLPSDGWRISESPPEIYDEYAGELVTVDQFLEGCCEVGCTPVQYGDLCKHAIKNRIAFFT